jgi:hypothetical protein
MTKQSRPGIYSDLVCASGYERALDEIDRLTRERDGLRAALERIAQMNGHNISTMARKVASTALSEQVEPSCTCWHQGENGPRVATSKDCPVHGTK